MLKACANVSWRRLRNSQRQVKLVAVRVVGY